MKKLLLTLFIAVFFFSCDEKPYVVINNSDFEVTYILNKNGNEKNYTIKPQTSENIGDRLYLKSFSATPPRVSFLNDYETLTFYNTPARQIKIVNSIDKNITGI